MRRQLLLFFLLTVASVGAVAQPVRTRTGRYTYVVPSYQSIDAAKKAALEEAKVQIIADEYGTVVGVRNLSRVSDANGESSSSFLQVGENEVKGEWIATVGEPEYEFSSSRDGMVIIKVTVTGKIREIKSSLVELDVRILRNGTGPECESEILKNGDDFFIWFKSPLSGYVAIYQYDSDGVFRLLPYKDSQGASIAVNAGEERVFFLDERGGELRSHYNIACDKEEDLCRYYIFFSPNRFAIANDASSGQYLPAQIDFKSFQKWLTRARKQDKDMISINRDVILKNK